MKIYQTDLEAKITNGSQHSYRGLCIFYNADETQSMQIDRTLQKLRRKGKIKFHREGGHVIWQSVKAQA